LAFVGFVNRKFEDVWQGGDKAHFERVRKGRASGGTRLLEPVGGQGTQDVGKQRGKATERLAFVKEKGDTTERKV